MPKPNLTRKNWPNYKPDLYDSIPYRYVDTEPYLIYGAVRCPSAIPGAPGVKDHYLGQMNGAHNSCSHCMNWQSSYPNIIAGELKYKIGKVFQWCKTFGFTVPKLEDTRNISKELIYRAADYPVVGTAMTSALKGDPLVVAIASEIIKEEKPEIPLGPPDWVPGAPVFVRKRWIEEARRRKRNRE